jgi:hypothetical protein
VHVRHQHVHLIAGRGNGLPALRPGVMIPSRSSHVNAFSGHFVFTVRTEVTDWTLIFGDRHLRSVLAEYQAYYNRRGPSQPPAPTTPPTLPRSGSSADPSSAASSMNTIGPCKSPGQRRWSNSGTPQAKLIFGALMTSCLGRNFTLPDGYMCVWNSSRRTAGARRRPAGADVRLDRLGVAW